MGVKPFPIAAVAATILEEGSGAVVLLVVGKFQVATPPITVHTPVPLFVAATVKLDFAVWPVSIPLILRLPLVFEYTPLVGAVTSTRNVHIPPGGILPFEKETEVAFAAAEIVGEPQPEFTALGVVATLI